MLNSPDINNRRSKTKHFVVLGGGTAGWLAACLIAKHWPQHRVTVVESPDIGIIGVGEGSTPQLKSFFDSLGLSEPEWMPKCNATYKAGISFHGWSERPGFESYFHPFQFSAHIEQADDAIEHCEFLSLDGKDPRRACAEALIASVPETGAVIAYFAAFERARILELAADFPDLSVALLNIASRIVDLLPVTRNHWYHRDQRGSWSIKAVLSTVSEDLSYKALAVSDGAAAQLAYLEAIHPNTSAERVAEIDRDLRIYCGQDTDAMVVLLSRLIAG